MTKILRFIFLWKLSHAAIRIRVDEPYYSDIPIFDYDSVFPIVTIVNVQWMKVVLHLHCINKICRGGAGWITLRQKRNTQNTYS